MASPTNSKMQRVECSCKDSCECVKSASCSDKVWIDSAGFPNSIGAPDDDESPFPCDVILSRPLACSGEVTCSTDDIPLCCGGLVSGSISGSGSWNCADDLSGCSGSISISGSISVSLNGPKFFKDWPSLLDFSVKFSRYFWRPKVLCSGAFAYTQDSVTLSATFLTVITAEMTGTFYKMATSDNSACKTARPNWIQNDLRDMVIAGKVDVCIFACWTLVSGNMFMVPDVDLPASSYAKKSRDCCVAVNAWASKQAFL